MHVVNPVCFAVVTCKDVSPSAMGRCIVLCRPRNLLVAPHLIDWLRHLPVQFELYNWLWCTLARFVCSWSRLADALNTSFERLVFLCYALYDFKVALRFLWIFE